MRIIVVEPDAALGLFLKKGLNGEGHDVSPMNDAQEALRLLEGGPADLLIVDVSEAERLHLLAAAQALQPRMAILSLSSNNSVEYRVRCLDMGADDCMTKPFSFQELTARCRALLRRQERLKGGETVLSHEGLRLERISRSATVNGRPITLTTKEFKLLEFLLQNAGQCCSRAELLGEVFQLPSENATNVVDVYINYLRKKLRAAGGSTRIVTVRGAGYQLARSERGDMGPIAFTKREVYATA